MSNIIEYLNEMSYLEANKSECKMNKIIFWVSLCIAIVTSNNLVKAQSFGVGAGFGTSSSMFVDLFYLENSNSFHLGFSYQFSDTRGKLVSEQKSNYGRTVDGTGEYFWTLDFGYGHNVISELTINGEISLGSLNEYTNYLDGRFNGGGYHMIDQASLVAGIGASVGYNLSESVNVFLGYNTLRKVTAGLRMNFPFVY
ncbi:MAG: hypothetical protein HUJ22_08765 [Gracilimonas sp.]|uniref:hypothetical protein n=1 Tax=Gracilimonas sp. TaxID=1974203 RepID=UPI001983EFE4|nr:hypothetical protein [Gracilimonas sp.]MBD3616652.1 hypothetical protein [Gracilimonas sp.]